MSSLDFPAELLECLGAIRAALRADGVAEDFDAEAWLRDWLQRPQPALGGARPMERLDTAQGRESVRRVLGAILSGSYQ